MGLLVVSGWLMPQMGAFYFIKVCPGSQTCMVNPGTLATRAGRAFPRPGSHSIDQQCGIASTHRPGRWVPLSHVTDREAKGLPALPVVLQCRDTQVNPT